MPFRKYTKEFTPATLVMMASAYDALVQARYHRQRPRSGELAIAIAHIVRAGEDDKDAVIKKAREVLA